MSELVSVEIGSHSVRVAQLVERRGRVRTIRFAEQELPNGFRWEIGGDYQPVVDAVLAALATAGIRSRGAIIVMPRGQVTTRISAFPAADHDEVRRVLEYDLSDHIPFPLEQVVFDFQELGPSADQPGLNDVLIVAAPLELVREYMRVAEEAGLEVAAITVDALALDDLARMLEREPPGLAAAMAVEARATTINISQGERLRLTRSVAVGSRQLGRAIAEDLGVSSEEAEQLKLTQGLGLLSREPPPAATRAWLESLLGEIRRSALSFGPARLSRLVLVGGESKLPGLGEALAAEFGVEPIHLSVEDVFADSELVGGDSEAADNCLAAISAAALAIGRSNWTISLVPAEIVKVRLARRARWLATAAVAASVLAMAALYVLLARDVSRLGGKVDALRLESESAIARQAEAQAILAERDQLKAQAEALEPVRLRRYVALELLRTIALYCPKEVVLTSFVLRPDEMLQLRGTAPNSAIVADMQDRLGQSFLVREVSLTGADRASGRSRTGADRSPAKNGGAADLNFGMQVRLWTQQETARGTTSLSPWGGSR